MRGPDLGAVMAADLSSEHPARTAAGSAQLVVSTLRQDTLWVTLRASGELDLDTSRVLADALASQLAGGRRYVRLDLSELAFCDCAGLDVLVQAHQRFLTARGTLRLTGVGPRIMRLVKLTGLDRTLFAVFVAAALTSA